MVNLTLLLISSLLIHTTALMRIPTMIQRYLINIFIILINIQRKFKPFCFLFNAFAKFRNYVDYLAIYSPLLPTCSINSVFYFALPITYLI